jgi:uncharacterized RDD family membrane protein YckC
MTAEVTPNASPVYASCLRRTGAMIVDCIIEVGVCVVILIKVLGLSGQSYNVVGQIIGIVYFVGFESSSWRGTPGKRLLGIYLADKDGNRISPLRSFARLLVLYVPGLPMIWLMFSGKLTAFDAAVQKTKQLSPSEQQAAMMSLFHENSALLGQLLIIWAGACVISLLLYWLPIIFTKQKTGLHDIVTNVRVLRKTEK